MNGRDVVAGRGSGDIGSNCVATCGRGRRGGGGVGYDDVVAWEYSVDCASEVGIRSAVEPACIIDVDDQRGEILRDGKGSGDDGYKVVCRIGTGNSGVDRVFPDGRSRHCGRGVGDLDRVTVQKTDLSDAVERHGRDTAEGRIRLTIRAARIQDRDGERSLRDGEGSRVIGDDVVG